MLKRETPFVLAFSALLVLSPAWAGDVAVSPDGRNRIEYADGKVTVSRDGRTLFGPQSAARETRDGAWYAGGITTAEARDCTLDTSFLDTGEWIVEIFRDASDAKEDAQRYVHETRKVKAGEKIPLHMAPGGGFVVRCRRISSASEIAD